MSMITQDALKVVTEHLSPTSRLNLAAIDQRFFDMATKWHDVKTIVFDDDDVTLAGANFVHTYENAAFQSGGTDGNKSLYKTDAKETALKLCPAIKKLIIQTKLSDFDAVMLNKLNLKLTKLYISTENLNLVNFPKFEKLRTLHLVVNSTKELRVVDVVEPRVLKAVFPQTLTRVCLTGIYLTENLLVHMSTLKNLACLDLIGCLVDTRVGAKYVPLLEQFPALEELSLPPSLFSFSVKSKTPSELTLNQLKVTKLGIYMDQFDDDTFYSQTRRFLPKQLKYLVVFGNYLPLKRWKLLSSVKNFVILFGPNTSLASCPQANLTNVKLLSHLVRGPPYIPQEYNPNFLRNHDVLIGNLTWEFSLIEWKDNAGSKKEVTALRRRLNAIDDEDVVFEGVRIAPPVIMERFGQMRNRFRFDPNHANRDDFQDALPSPIRALAALPAPNIPPPPPLPPRRRSRSREPVLPRHRPQQTINTTIHRLQRRERSAPPAITLPADRRPPQSESMRTNPPSPPVGTLTGVVAHGTLSTISPIGANTTASRVGGTTTTTATASVSTATTGIRSDLNRAFIVTPGTSSGATMGSSESRRLSTASVVSTSMNSEITMQSTATASPERLSQVSTGNGSQLRTPPPPPTQNHGPNTSHNNTNNQATNSGNAPTAGN